MDFKLLKEVIKHIKRHGKCPECERKYTDTMIDVIGTTGDNAFFYLMCPDCSANLILQTAVVHKDEDSDYEITEESTFTPEEFSEKISSNDILDMHNFLKNFDGDLSNHINT